MRTGVVFDRRYADHVMGPAHIESPRRIEVLNRMLEERPPVEFPRIAPRPAEESEIAWVHDPGYIGLVKATAGHDLTPLDPDTSAGPKTFETALLAAGGFLELLDAVMSGRVENGFALVRPPGHHAEAARAMGFCIFNNVAIAAEYLIRRHGLSRILIVDWDVHHGNGSQHAFYRRSDVLYFSTHRWPFYPGTGAASELGLGPGAGFNLNVPLLPGKAEDDFVYILEKILAPVAAQFRPEFILVSAGYDIGVGDPLGGMSVSRAGFGTMADSLLRMAAASCRGRLAYVLEGGYSLPMLRDGVEETLVRLAAGAPAAVPLPDLQEATRVELAPTLRLFRDHWDI